jgi:alkaline phosphatase D
MLSRRDLGIALGLALVPGPACDPDEPGPATSILLDVEEERALVVVWSATAMAMTVTIAHVDGRVVGRFHGTFGESGLSTVDARGLEPTTTYIAAIGLDDTRVLQPHVFVTPPRADDPRPVRIAWSADIDPDPAYDSPIFETLAAEEADLFVSLGDWPYADNPPFPETLDDYRRRHVESRSWSKLQPWLHTTSVRAMLDDHEVRNDWDAGSYALDTARHDAALQAWDEWFPRRGAAGVRYQRWRWGAHVECFLLDTRSFRSASADPDGANKTMLGAAQLAWLLDGVAASRAAFKLVFTTVPLDYGNGVDHWAGYTVERDLILDAFADAAIPGVVFLSADQHWFATQTHRNGAREFQVGPLSRAPLLMPPLRRGVIARSAEYCFGVVDASSEGLRIRALGATGNVLWDETFTPQMLTLRRS